MYFVCFVRKICEGLLRAVLLVCFLASATGTLAEAPRVPRVALKDEDGRAARGRRLGRLGFFVRRVCAELKGSKNPSEGLRLEGLGFWA